MEKKVGVEVTRSKRTSVNLTFQALFLSWTSTNSVENQSAKSLQTFNRDNIFIWRIVCKRFVEMKQMFQA